MNYWLGVIGTWIFADGIASLYTYTCTDKAKGQSWVKDHSFRIPGLSEGGHGVPKFGGIIRKFGKVTPELKLLSASLSSPIEFKPPHGGRTAFGYEATILADICDAILSLRKEMKTKSQTKLVERCETLMRGFARVGIIALVDKATGYDKYVTRHYYEAILRKWVSPELQKYPSTFPDEFYFEIFRLRNWNATDD
jgi:hypothetical protein